MTAKRGNDWMKTLPEDVQIRLRFARDSHGQDIGALGTNSANRLNRTRWADQYYRTGVINPDMQASMDRNHFTKPEAYFKDVQERYAYHEHGQKLEISRVIGVIAFAAVQYYTGDYVSASIAGSLVYSLANILQGENAWELTFGVSYGSGVPPGSVPPNPYDNVTFTTEQQTLGGDHNVTFDASQYEQEGPGGFDPYTQGGENVRFNPVTNGDVSYGSHGKPLGTFSIDLANAFLAIAVGGIAIAAGDLAIAVATPYVLYGAIVVNMHLSAAYLDPAGKWNIAYPSFPQATYEATQKMQQLMRAVPIFFERPP